MSLVGKKALNFKAKAVMQDDYINESFDLSDYTRGFKCLLFFYPLDFTFVCPSEIIAFSSKTDEFEKRNAKVVGVSVDSHFSHIAWRNTPYEKGGIQKVRFPLVSDITKNISKSYQVLIEEEGIALRGAFIIDEEFTVRHMLVNDLPLGRNVDEFLRVMDAMDHHQKHGEVCPAGWNKGEEAMKPSSEGVAKYIGNVSRYKN